MSDFVMIGPREHSQKCVTDGRTDVSLENGLAATPTRKEELCGTYNNFGVLGRLLLLSFRVDATQHFYICDGRR